jgi:hypothetical protein
MAPGHLEGANKISTSFQRHDTNGCPSCADLVHGLVQGEMSLLGARKTFEESCRAAVRWVYGPNRRDDQIEIG